MKTHQLLFILSIVLSFVFIPINKTYNLSDSEDVWYFVGVGILIVGTIVSATIYYEEKNKK